MRISEILVEAPIGDWIVASDFERSEEEMVSKFTGYRGEQKHWSDVDKNAMKDEAIVQKIRNAFLKTSATFNLYFYQSRNPDYDPLLQYGEIDAEMLKKKIPSHAGFVLSFANPDVITILMTNNLSDEHKISMKSPWMVAHRIAHAIQGRGDSVSYYFTRYIRKILENGYGLEWPDWNSMIEEDYIDIYSKVFGHTFGTMKSARKGHLVQGAEWHYETFTQYIINGKVTMKPLPNEIDEGLFLTTDPEKLRRVQKLHAAFPAFLEKYFEKLLTDAKGKIFVN